MHTHTDGGEEGIRFISEEDQAEWEEEQKVLQFIMCIIYMYMYICTLYYSNNACMYMYNALWVETEESSQTKAFCSNTLLCHIYVHVHA